MMRRSYPHTSDPAVLESQRGAAMARSIAAVAVVCGIFAMLALTVRDVQRTDGPRVSTGSVLTARTSDVRPEAPSTSPSAPNAIEVQPSVDYSEYPSTF